MPLTVKYAKVKNGVTLVKKNSNEYECIALSAMVLGFSEITEKNLKEIVHRWNRYSEEVVPIALTKTKGTLKMTEARLRRWIGMETNVAPVTNAGFDQLMRKWTHRNKKGI